MSSKYPSVDLDGLKTMSIHDRVSKVDVVDFATAHAVGSSLVDFIDHLPSILAGKDIRTVIARIAAARESGKPLVVAMGAHVIKCGLSPLISDMIRRGIITALAMNGAGAIHDSEIARFGRTSEDVVDGMRTGVFGMARETADFVNSAAIAAAAEGLGLGEALGRSIAESGAPNADVSILAAAYEASVPVTIHVGIGCDIVHMHPSSDGGAIGEASLHDFRILTQAMSNLGSGGVLMNVGSAVMLPEVILKAVTTLINLGFDMSGILGVNLDLCSIIGRINR